MDLCNELTSMANLKLPWFVLGVFNAIHDTSEHRGGSFRYYDHKAKLFSYFINRALLMDIKFVGAEFTWCNGQASLAHC